jgi:hemoglobin-like flavoprotein
MTPEQIALVEQSFAKILPIKDRAAGLVYDRLFEIDPSLRALFKGDMARQRSMLAVAIAMIVRGLRTPVTIVPALQEMGRRHAGYGVRPEHYATVGEALLWALERALGEGFTPETRTAWAEAYDLVASTMIEAAASGRTIARAA